LHEMVEAATDPFPPLDVVTTGCCEIADIGQSANCSTTTPFGGSALTGSFTDNVAVQNYWSNVSQGCAGFSSAEPSITTPAKMAGTGPGASLSIEGHGFGTLPKMSTPLRNAKLPYIAIRSERRDREWEAGNMLNGDMVTLDIDSWSDNKIITAGFHVINHNSKFALTPGDDLTISVCNPDSGKCSKINYLTPPGIYAPRLTVREVTNPPTDRGLFNVKIDETLIATGLSNGGTTRPQDLNVGPHVIKVEGTGHELFRIPDDFSRGLRFNGKNESWAGRRQNMLSDQCPP
jgi:hypothetical protein